MDRSRWMDVILGALLFALAFALRVPLLDAPPYGDENLHYVVAAHPSHPTPQSQDLWGNPLGAPSHLAWQRPAYYLAFHAPALAGFHIDRIAHAAVASLLAPLGYALVRAHGVRRVAASLAGIGLAVTPALVVWGAYALMDVAATVLLLAMLLARHRGRLVAVAVLGTLAIWTKETMAAPVLVLFAIDLVRALRIGQASLDPLRLTPRLASLAWPLVLGPVPLVVALALGLPAPGGAAQGDTWPLLELVFPTVWVIPVMALGLLWRRSRFLSAAGLAGGLSFMLMHSAGRSIEAWYAPPSLALAIVGTAAAADVALQQARTARWTRQMGAVAVALIAFAGVLVAAVLPHGAARELLYPMPAPAPAPLADRYDFELELRDQDLMSALAQVPWDEHPDVLVAHNAWPPPFVGLQEADRIVLDFPWVHSLAGLDSRDMAARIENTTTWTLLGGGDEPLQRAIRDVYADCVVGTHGQWQVIRGAPCAGRGADLRAAAIAFGGPS